MGTQKNRPFLNVFSNHVSKSAKFGKKNPITKKAGAKLLREINGNKTVIPDFDRFNFFGG